MKQCQHSESSALGVPRARAAREEAGALVPSPCSGGCAALSLTSASGTRQRARAKCSEGLCCPGQPDTTGLLFSKPCTARVTPIRPESHKARSGQLQHHGLSPVRNGTRGGQMGGCRACHTSKMVRGQRGSQSAGGMLHAAGALHWEGDWKQLKKTCNSHLNSLSDPIPGLLQRSPIPGGAEKSPTAGVRAGEELGSTTVF